jgi:hypothetical protein
VREKFKEANEDHLLHTVRNWAAPFNYFYTLHHSALSNLYTRTVDHYLSIALVLILEGILALVLAPAPGHAPTFLVQDEFARALIVHARIQAPFEL